MATNRHKYYPKRQIVNMALVDPDEYDERIILCIPAFAWRVARAFLSVQAQWASTYAESYETDYYLSPDAATMDTIRASIDEALSVDDMSCDITAAIEALGDALTGQMSDDNELIVEQLAALVAKECAAGCGSSGAGSEEGPPSEYVDDGETPPDGFPDYGTYDVWKCGVATIIIDQIMADLDYLKDLAITEITTIVVGAAMLTPIPFDEVAVMVGVIITWFVEDTLDDYIDEILVDMGIDEETLKCALYNSLDVSSATMVLEEWANTNIGTMAAFLLSFFINNDSLNRLFEEGNQVLPDVDCSSCPDVCQNEWILKGTGTVYSDRVEIDADLYAGIRYWAEAMFDRELDDPYPACGDGVTVTGIDVTGTINGYYVTYNDGTPAWSSTTEWPTWPQENVGRIHAKDGDSGATDFQITIYYER